MNNNKLSYQLRRVILIYVLLGVVFCTIGCKSKKTITKSAEPTIEYDDKTLVKFIVKSELSTVLEYSKKENELTLVEFYTKWCLPCQLMDETVFNNETLAKFYNQNFNNLKIDAESTEGQNLRFIFGVKQYPTFLFLDHRGRVISQTYGSKTISEMMLFGEDAIKVYQDDTTRVQ